MPSIDHVWVLEHRDPAGKKCHSSTPGATKHRYRSTKYYGFGVPGLGKRRVPLCADRRAAEKMLADLVRAAERGAVGLAPPPPPLADLLAEFAAALARRSGGPHVREVVGHARHVLAACGCEAVADLSAPGLVARAEAAVWATAGPPLSSSPATTRKYGAHLRQFTRWLHLKRHLLDRDPLAGLDLPREAARRPRRDLTVPELARLFAATAASEAVFRWLAGADRLAIYLLAAATGFRAGEVGRLTPDRFDLAADPPAVRPVPHGPRSKTKDGGPQPLPPAVADRLRPYLAGLPAGRVVWPGGWAADAAEMVRRDLAEAGIPAITPAGEAVFHSLRHSFTSLVVPVADVRTAQELLRHKDPNLTIGRYAHATEAAKAEAVRRMGLPVPG